jgi:phosphatidylserine/phosphatidylglycerophosphate/cardiolipin synthase-like enzyme
MTDPFQELSERDLQEVALALRSGRLSPPYARFSLQRVLPGDLAIAAADDLHFLARNGFGAEQIAVALDLLRRDRHARPRVEDVLELVTTGPEVPGIDNRDTSVVVRELFANARESVLVAGYAVYQGQRVFQALADRMLEIPELNVRMFLDIQRVHGDSTSATELIRKFSERFRLHQWPKDRPLPEVHFDARSLEIDADRRACLHAKCVVVDGREVFVSSANFTEAAHHRNLEVGIKMESREIALRISGYFDALLRANLLTRAI